VSVRGRRWQRSVALGLVVCVGAPPVWAQPEPYGEDGGVTAEPAPPAEPADAAADEVEPEEEEPGDDEPEPAPRRLAPADDEPWRTRRGDGGAELRYSLEGIEIRGNLRTADRVVLRYVPFAEGDVLDVGDPELELLRYRLLGTGFFSEARVSLRKGSGRGRVVLVIDVVERNTLILENIVMGVAADENEEGESDPISPFLGVQAAETNLAGTGITLGAGFGVAADQFSLRARFADPAFAGSSWMLTASLFFVDARDFFGNKQVTFESPQLDQDAPTDYAVVDYQRFGGTIGVGHDLGLTTRLLVEYGLERVDAVVPTVASHVRGDTREPIEFDILPGVSVLSILRAELVHDTRDAPFLPTQGWLAVLRGTVGVEPLGSSYGYGKIEANVAHWWRLPFHHVVSIEGRLGAIAGDAPFFEKFYVGDYTDLLPDRVLGLNPDRRQPPNYLGTDIVEVRYGDYAARLEGEYRIPLYSGHESVYGVDAFGSTGIYLVAGRREITDPPSGYDGAGLVPVDLTYNLGLRVETFIGGFSIAFSNLLGLLPARGGGRK
jgi:outer membrane protein insertion porin family